MLNGSNRVKRGGSWNNNADNCQVVNRNNNNPNNRNNNIGFRVVSRCFTKLHCARILMVNEHLHQERANMKFTPVSRDEHFARILLQEKPG